MNDGTPHPVRLSRAQSKIETHRLLLDAAERVFIRLGYQGATLDGIAAEVGFTKGAVYWHFRNKEALFLELLSDGLKSSSQDLDQLLTMIEEQPEHLDDELGKWIDELDTRNNMPLLGIEMDLELRRNPSFATLLAEINLRHQQTISRIMVRYFDVSGRRPPMPVEDLAASLIAATKAIALARQTHSRKLTSSILVRAMLGMPTSR